MIKITIPQETVNAAFPVYEEEMNKQNLIAGKNLTEFYALSNPNLVGVSDNLGFVQGCATKEDQMALKKILEAAAPHIIDANLPKSEWRTDWRNLKEGDWVAFPVKQTKRPNLGIIKRLKNDDFENELWVTQGKNYFPFSFFEGFILLPQPPKDV